MTDAMTTDECIDSITHGGSCCEGGRRPFSQRKEPKECGFFDPVIPYMDPIKMLDRAEQVIQERGEVYGPFDVNMYGTALQISGMLAQFYSRTDLPVLPAYMAAMIATAFKSNRIVKSPAHEDSHLDHGNYLKKAKELADQ